MPKKVNNIILAKIFIYYIGSFTLSKVYNSTVFW